MKYKLVYIEWEDACSSASWFNNAEVDNWTDEKNSIIKEVGWIIRETKEWVTLATRLGINIADDAEEYGLLQKIPKTWIRKRKVLKI